MSAKIRMLLVALAVVVIAILVWFFVLQPVRDDIAAVDTQIQEEQTRLSQAQIRLAQAEATREEGRRNEARLMELAKMMPTTAELPSLLLQIQDLADQSGIQFVAITPGEPEPSESADYRMLSLDLQFNGTFFDVSDFIYRAEQMVSGPGRLLAIKDLQFSLGGSAEAPGGSPELAVDVTMYAFMAGGGAVATAPATPTDSAESSTDVTTTSQ